MMWKNIKLYIDEKTGYDQLGNPICKKKLQNRFLGRLTDWSNGELMTMEREVTKNEQKLLLRIPFSLYPGADYVEIDGIVYKVTNEYAMSNRFTLLHIKVVKQ